MAKAHGSPKTGCRKKGRVGVESGLGDLPPPAAVEAMTLAGRHAPNTNALTGEMRADPLPVRLCLPAGRFFGPGPSRLRKTSPAKVSPATRRETAHSTLPLRLYLEMSAFEAFLSCREASTAKRCHFET
jgi:hypothetical protein